MEEIVMLCEEEMDKAIVSFKNSLASLRTGRVSLSILDAVMVDYYGTPTPISQMASVSIPEPMQILIKPYAKEDVKAIIAALNVSNIGVNPLNDGASIRLQFPPLTTDRRVEIAKVAKKYAEEGKIAIRNIRRDYNEEIKQDKTLSEDMSKSLIEDIQKVTDTYIKKIEDIFATKEKEITTL